MLIGNLYSCLLATLALSLACLAIEYQDAVDEYRMERLVATRSILQEAEDTAMRILFGDLTDPEKLATHLDKQNELNEEGRIESSGLPKEEYLARLVGKYVKGPCGYYLDAFKGSLREALLTPSPELEEDIEENSDFQAALVAYQVCESILAEVERKNFLNEMLIALK